MPEASQILDHPRERWAARHVDRDSVPGSVALRFDRVGRLPRRDDAVG